MAKVYVSTLIAVPVERVWAIARDFNNLPAWLPPAAASVIEAGHAADKIGAIRAVTLRNGALMREKLVALDDELFSCTYRIIESPLPLLNFIATLDFHRITVSDSTFARWRAEFDVLHGSVEEAVHNTAEQVYKPGLAALGQLARELAA